MTYVDCFYTNTDLHHVLGIIYLVLTEFDEALREFEHALEATVLGVGCPRKRVEDDQQPLVAGVQHQVALLATVGADLRRRVVRTIVHPHIVEWTAEKSGTQTRLKRVPSIESKINTDAMTY